MRFTYASGLGARIRRIDSSRAASAPGILTSGSLQAAAASWQQLSAELQASAQTYRSVVSDLITWHWVGRRPRRWRQQPPLLAGGNCDPDRANRQAGRDRGERI
nr:MULTISPECIES: PPE domain-containing protein [Mycobacterium]